MTNGEPGKVVRNAKPLYYSGDTVLSDNLQLSTAGKTLKFPDEGQNKLILNKDGFTYKTFSI